MFRFCVVVNLDFSSRRPLQPTPCQGASTGPELHTVQSDHPRWQMRPRGQREHLVVPPGDDCQMAAGAQQPPDP